MQVSSCTCYFITYPHRLTDTHSPIPTHSHPFTHMSTFTHLPIHIQSLPSSILLPSRCQALELNQPARPDTQCHLRPRTRLRYCPLPLQLRASALKPVKAEARRSIAWHDGTNRDGTSDCPSISSMATRTRWGHRTRDQDLEAKEARRVRRDAAGRGVADNGVEEGEGGMKGSSVRDSREGEKRLEK